MAATALGGAWAVPVLEFADWLRAEGKPRTTIRLYTHYVSTLAAAHPAGPWGLQLDDLVRFLGAAEWKPDTRKSARTALRAFYRWAAVTGRVEKSPALDLPSIPIPRRRARPALDDAISAAVARVDVRERRMILLGRYAGLRCCEIAKVHVDDVAGGELYVAGKGGHTRVVPLHPLLVDELDGCAGYVFPGLADGHLSSQYVSRLLSRVLGAGLTAHMLRHTFATSMVDAGVSIHLVKELLGHESIETTMTYVRTNRERLRGAVLAGAATPYTDGPPRLHVAA